MKRKKHTAALIPLDRIHFHNSCIRVCSHMLQVISIGAACPALLVHLVLFGLALPGLEAAYSWHINVSGRQKAVINIAVDCFFAASKFIGIGGFSHWRGSVYTCEVTQYSFHKFQSRGKTHNRILAQAKRSLVPG
jgi:hypothetical protein